AAALCPFGVRNADEALPGDGRVEIPEVGDGPVARGRGTERHDTVRSIGRVADKLSAHVDARLLGDRLGAVAVRAVSAEHVDDRERVAVHVANETARDVRA